MKLVRMPSVWGTLYWSLRSWWMGYYVPTDKETWKAQGPFHNQPDLWRKEQARVERMWEALRAFFAGYGYTLFEALEPGRTIPRRSAKRPSAVENEYPFARVIEDDDRHFEFYPQTAVRVWAARNAEGRDVMIKLVSFPDAESDELKVYKRLNTPEARADSRNHTLPVLDWLVYDGLTFVVMPRWGVCVATRFYTANQCLHMAESLLEGLVFFHENKVAHRDIDAQNIVINALSGPLGYDPCKREIREPDKARYAFIDYDVSTAFPLDTDIETCTVLRNYRIGHVRLRMPRGVMCNPFKDDVLLLTRFLQTYTRAIERGVPEIGPFYDKIMSDLSNPPTAVEVLERLRSLRAGLTDEALNYAPEGKIWKPSGEITRLYED